MAKRYKLQNPISGPRVADKASQGRHGTVLRAGVEVSEVRWDDGRTQILMNDYLLPIEPQPVRNRAAPKRGRTLY